MNTEDFLNIAKDRWQTTPYYDRAEGAAEAHFNNFIKPLLDKYLLKSKPNFCIELACGHGRITQFLIDYFDTVLGIDIVPENIDFCKRRFENSIMSKFQFNVCNGIDFDGIADRSSDLVLCWDSMVHFDTDIIRQYIRDTKRILKERGIAIYHHSNYTKDPTGNFQKAPHARNFMSKELFAHYSYKEGLMVLEQNLMNWGGISNHDCISVLALPSYQKS